VLEKEKLKEASPVISVVLPVYNAEKYIAIAIESVLDQTFSDFEFIIVDDCSTDASWEIIQKYSKRDKRIVALRNEVNLKGCNTLNKGLKLAKGKYIARMDNDDRCYPDRFEKQFNFMESHPEVGIVGGSMELIDESGNLIGKRTYNLSDSEIRKNIFRYSPFSHPLVMIRKSVLDKVGYYNPDHAPSDDYDLYFRLGMVSQFANMSDVILQYRMVHGSMTFSLTKNMELTTINVRNLYSRNPHYRFGFADRIYNVLHYISVFVIPSRLKIYLFNLMRNSR